MSRTTHQRKHLIVPVIVLSWIVAGCTSLGFLDSFFGHKPADHVHTIRWPGETLSIIAKWYTGDAENWRALAQANPNLDPNFIRVGDRIRIHSGLLKTREPMPHGFIGKFTPERQSEPASSRPPPEQSQPEETGELDLFGPK
ncbi:MAG: LysM peptidoglycan-binding domain-containing protein [Syntrophobacteria bacterium]